MRFTLQSSSLFLNHRSELPHPESPERLLSIFQSLERAPVENAERTACTRLATKDDLMLVHTERLVDEVAATAGSRFMQLDTDTYTCADSYLAALTASGAVLDAVDGAIHQTGHRFFSLVRPPGHHAERDRAMGFCLFNHIALGAQHAIARHGLDRVAIYDFDLHHGNGTQEIFYSRPDVLYLSHHQFPFYPGTGSSSEVGEGEGKGKTLNCPLPSGAGDAEVFAVWDRIFSPVLEQFKPQILLVSAGYDAHESDPLGELAMTDNGFLQLSYRLETLAQKLGVPMIYVLEGGYNGPALAEGVQSAVRASFKPQPAGIAETANTLSLGMEYFSDYWKF